MLSRPHGIVVSFEYELGDVVEIKAISQPGTIVGFYYSIVGTQYQVAYFFAGIRYAEYLFPSEITPRSTKKAELGLSKP
jgi:hypothetical protein